MLLVFFALDNESQSIINTYLTQIASGNTDDFELLYNKIGGRMLSVAIGIVRDRFLAEEVVQDSLIKILQSIDSYNNRKSGYAWICKIVQNTAINKIKYENRRRGTDIDSIFDLPCNSNIYEESLATLLKDGLMHLSRNERLAIWLKYYNNMSVREIAKELYLKKSTTQDLINRAEKNLASLLENPYKSNI